MTSNRAHKRAARAIAAKENIRYPEADTLADPKVISGERPRPKQLAVSTDPSDPELAALAAEMLNFHEGLVLGPGVVSPRDPFHYIRRITGELHGFNKVAEEQKSQSIELQQVRIIFARRYADMAAAGLDPMRSLDLMRTSLEGVPAAEQIIEAIPAIKTQLATGYTAAEAWRPHLELLGTHLYQMLTLSESVGWSPTPFRDAANTIEAEMRLEAPKGRESVQLLADQAERRLIKLGVPKAAQDFAKQQAGGLFLISGATGAGKTTTGEALFRYAQAKSSGPAFAIMDPAETYILAGSDATPLPVQYSDNAVPALHAALQGSAGVIFIDTQFGQPELIEAALDAALAGTLVFATIHCQASEASQRLLDAFPEGGNRKVRAKVELALRGVIEQVLVRGEGRKGRVLASEVWASTAGGDESLTPVLTLEESLDSLVAEGTVLKETADQALARRW